MTQPILALRERRNALANEARKLVNDNKGDQWKPEHNEQFDKVNAEIERIDAEIVRNQKVLDNDAVRAFKEAGVRETDDEGMTPARAVNKWLRNGTEGMSNDDWGLARQLMTAENNGFRIVRNTMSGDPANGGQGGYTVQTDIVGSITEALKQYGGMRDVAEVFQTEGGNPMNFPTSDGTSEVGELVPENTAASAQDATFGTVGLSVYKFSSKIIAVPFELLQDSSVNIEAFLAKRMATRLGRSQNQYFTFGTGTNQPRGVVAAAASGKVGATGQTGTVVYDDLVDLEHSVDPAYRNQGKCRFMFHDNTLAVLRKLKDSQGRPIFLPGYYDNGIAAGIPDTLLGRPFTINQDVATMAANAKSILFGDFTNYKIRDAMQITMFRFTDSVYTSKGQVGFLCWMRSGGNLIDTGGPVKYYANSAT